METAFHLTIDDQQIAHLVFDLPNEKVNTFSLPVLQELEQKIDEISHDPDIKLLVLSSNKDGVFIAGADLHSFDSMTRNLSIVTTMIDTGHRVFSKLEKLRIPTVALIDGACLGGGLEMALACTYRVVSDSTRTVLGLPEVTLGIIPGWGGTQRLPRLIGLVEALPLILSGKPIKGYKAWKIGLADALLPTEFFKTKSKEFLNYCQTTAGQQKLAQQRSKRGWQQYLLEKNPIGRALLFHRAKKELLAKTHGHYPAPLVALDLIKDTLHYPLQQGLEEEADTFKSNMSTTFSSAQHLINLFFTQEELKKETWIPNAPAPQPVNAAGVIGAGTMGSGIAWLFSNRDIPVRLKDIEWNAIGKGLGNAYSIYADMLKKKKIKPNELSLKFHHISGTSDYSGFSHLDLVVEAAVENLDLKRKILSELEQILPSHAIIGTNTSSLTLSAMHTSMAHPERLVGMHFFNPANRMPLVEVVASKKTSPEAIVTAVSLCRRLGKTPIVVGDCPGFLVNRVFMMGTNEIMHMYEEDVPFEQLETSMLNFGMPMSPFVLADEVGNDICYKVGKIFEEAYGPRMALPKLMIAMYEHQLLGKKNGQGFYLYAHNKRKPNPAAQKLQQSFKRDVPLPSEQEIQDRVFLSMINEAARCLEENVISNPAYLDMALIMGIGFPPFRGGLLRYADTLGIDYIVDQLNRFQERYGQRFAPCQRLIAMHHAHDTFL